MLKSKIKIFSHNDLDGIGSIVLLNVVNHTFRYDICLPDSVEQSTNPRQVGVKLKSFIENEEYEKYDKVFITDLYINKETAEMIDKINYNNKFLLFDHHKHSLYLNDYEWATVAVDIDGVLTCGTELFWKYLYEIEENIDIRSTRMLEACMRFVELIRLYDTWDWFNNPSVLSEDARQLNILFKIDGYKKFKR